MKASSVENLIKMTSTGLKGSAPAVEMRRNAVPESPQVCGSVSDRLQTWINDKNKTISPLIIGL